MFSLARRRREAERQKKLEEQFAKADANGNGRITAEQMIKIFEDNEVQGIFTVFPGKDSILKPLESETWSGLQSGFD